MKTRNNRRDRSGAYLTKRMFLSSSARAIRAAAAAAISIEGFAIIARNGWVVKKYADGKVERLSRIEEVKRPSKIVLD